MQGSSSRELFASRAGFILMSAGCAIGLGNVWRFSYIAGQYGGGFFVLLYLFFLAVLGFPIMLMELAVGRAGRSTFPGAFKVLQPNTCKYQWYKPVYLLFSGNLILLMFYSVITGWLLIYSTGYITGKFSNVSTEDCANIFNNMLNAPVTQMIGTFAGIAVTFLVCIGGIRKTIEKTIKIMMFGLFVLLIILLIQANRLPNAMQGISFFLKPDWHKFMGDGILDTIHAAMAQAFFTLSLGVGSMSVCGSYMSRDRSLANEGVWIIVLDTMVAIFSGLIIFPACAAFSINPNAGPPLIFITLPNIFANMQYGMFWGLMFFIFLAIAALSTLIAVFENLVAFGMDQMQWSRKCSSTFFAVIVSLFSLPCIFGFNLWKNFQPLGKGSNVLDLEDFIISDNLLPLGAFYVAIFCMSRYGWGKENFLNEINTGKGWKFPAWLFIYCKWVLPIIILLIWVIGIAKRFGWL